VFLHDQRLKSDSVRARPVKNNRNAATVKDAFYWPDMQVNK